MNWLKRLFKSKDASRTEPVYVVVYRAAQRPGFEEITTKAQALDAFAQCVARGWITPGNHRRLLVTGPDYCVQPDDPHDPLLIGPAALRAVLTAEEYAARPEVQVASAALVAL